MKVRLNLKHLVFALIFFPAHLLATDLADGSIRWLDQGKPLPVAMEAVQILQRAHDEGLDPQDYDVAVLAGGIRQAASGSMPSTASQKALANALENSMRRYLQDLYYGRVDPASVYANFRPPRKMLDIQAALDEALAAGGLESAVMAAAPQFPLYQSLKPWLARFRSLENDPAWSRSLLPLPANKLEPGAAYEDLPLLVARLISLGDLSPDVVAVDSYQGTLVEGIKQFQARHGLAADGVIGKATFAQLNLPPSARVEQIALTMERLRWTPLMTNRRMLVVNLPEFVVRGLEIDNGQVKVSLQMNVIIGKALNTQTPMFDEMMSMIEFSPYWEVPQSIARAELVPTLRRDPAYFDRQGFEIVSRSGQTITQLTDQALAAVVRGDARLRQRPGPKNALGNIKFIFPNDDSIYMHHTPAVGLFQKDRRDFSHGCIRVENPLALAEFVLQDEPERRRENIVAAMEAGKSKTIRLKKPIPVVIAYGTAIVKKRGGPIYFYQDIYGHDRQLKEALQRQRQVLRETSGASGISVRQE